MAASRDRRSRLLKPARPPVSGPAFRQRWIEPGVSDATLSHPRAEHVQRGTHVQDTRSSRPIRAFADVSSGQSVSVMANTVTWRYLLSVMTQVASQAMPLNQPDHRAHEWSTSTSS